MLNCGESLEMLVFEVWAKSEYMYLERKQQTQVTDL